MKIAELRKLDAKGLLKALKKAQEKLFKARFEVKTGQAKNIHLIHEGKKEVAQIKTLLSELPASEEKKEESNETAN